MSEEKVKREHYVPRFYIKKFAENDKIDVYLAEKDKIIKDQLIDKNYACIKNFYDINPLELKDELEKYFSESSTIEEKKAVFNNKQLIEKTFANMEADISSQFIELEKNPYVIETDEFRIKFCIFIRDLSIRTHNFREKMERIKETKTEHLKKMGIEIEGETNISPSEQAKLEQLRSIVSLPQLVNDCQDFLANYDFILGINDTKYPFILSDNPAAFAFIHAKEICIPINKRLSVILRRKLENEDYFTKLNITNNSANLTEQNVTIYNLIQFFSANKFVFGEENELARIYPFKKISSMLRKI